MRALGINEKKKSRKNSNAETAAVPLEKQPPSYAISPHFLDSHNLFFFSTPPPLHRLSFPYLARVIFPPFPLGTPFPIFTPPPAPTREVPFFSEPTRGPLVSLHLVQPPGLRTPLGSQPNARSRRQGNAPLPAPYPSLRPPPPATPTSPSPRVAPCPQSSSRVLHSTFEEHLSFLRQQKLSFRVVRTVWPGGGEGGGREFCTKGYSDE